MSPKNSSKTRLVVFLLRFLISKNEYECLEVILSPYTPHRILAYLPSTADFNQRPRSPNRELSIREAAIGTRDEYLPSTVRQGTRVFAATYVLATLVDVVLIGIIKKHGRKEILSNLRNKRSFRTALATSTTVALYRTLLRIFKRPSLPKRLSPSFLAGVLSGLAFALHPADSRRVTITIYFLTRTLEFAYNVLDDKGYLPRNKPWWFGSWLIFPLSSAQLLHAFVFDRDCFPKGYGDFILKYSSPYISERPATLPQSVPWPDRYEIIDALIPISELNYPKFYSPTLFRGTNLPDSLHAVEPLISGAHPGISKLSCALLHPSETSCLKIFAQFIGKQWTQVGKFITAVYLLIGLVTYRSIKRSPEKALPALLERLLRTTTFITMAIGTSWGSICLFQNVLPAKFLPTKRFFLSGLLGGLWAFIDRKKGRGRFLYSARLSIESGWNVAVKRGLVKPVKGGDVVLFALSLGVLMGVFEKAPGSITGSTVRKTISWMGGRGFIDPVPRADEMRNQAAMTLSSVTSIDFAGRGSSLYSVDQGSADAGSVGDSEGESGSGIRVLDEDLVKSPTSMQ